MPAGPWIVWVLSTEIEAARYYAELSKDYTLRKLEQQRSRFADGLRLSNIVNGHVARLVVARVLRDQGISNVCDDSPHTETKRFCIQTAAGWLVQTRFVGNQKNYLYLFEDVGSFERRPHHFYVALTSRDDLSTMEMLGYATSDEMAQREACDFGQQVANRYTPLSDLHPIEDLVSLLRSTPVGDELRPHHDAGDPRTRL